MAEVNRQAVLVRYPEGMLSGASLGKTVIRGADDPTMG